MIVLLLGAELFFFFHTGGRTDRYGEAKSHFSKFGNAPKNRGCKLLRFVWRTEARRKGIEDCLFLWVLWKLWEYFRAFFLVFNQNSPNVVSNVAYSILFHGAFLPLLNVLNCYHCMKARIISPVPIYRPLLLCGKKLGSSCPDCFSPPCKETVRASAVYPGFTGKR